MLAKSDKIDQSQGIPDTGVRLLVKLAHSLLLNLAVPLFFRAAFHAMSQATKLTPGRGYITLHLTVKVFLTKIL